MLAALARRCNSALRCAPPLTRRAMSSYKAPEATEDATIKIEFDVPYQLHKLEDAPASYTYTSKQELLDYFTLMCTWPRPRPRHPISHTGR